MSVLPTVSVTSLLTHHHFLFNPQALHHPYFFALPYPTHPSKLPKTSSQLAPRPLDEVDGNVDQDAPGPAVKAAPPTSRLKRKASLSDAEARSVARKLDFSKVSQRS